ncbi:hypothetical protein IV102_38575 [bacterium]|nr:hypothetical protein [bacterium]
MKRASLLVCLLSLLELHRDIGFMLLGQANLSLGMSLKLSTGTVATVGLWKGWLVGYACLVGWCLQGMLMSVGDWMGQGPNLISASSLLVRTLLLGWFVQQRIVRREVKQP